MPTPPHSLPRGIWGTILLPVDARDQTDWSALAEELMEETVTADRVGDAECIFLTGLYLAERGIANQIQRIRSGPLPWPEIDADKALPWIEQKTGLALAASQAEAVRLALRSKIMVITGGPGVGKTMRDQYSDSAQRTCHLISYPSI